jgi:hypothetical protein
MRSTGPILPHRVGSAQPSQLSAAASDDGASDDFTHVAEVRDAVDDAPPGRAATSIDASRRAGTSGIVNPDLLIDRTDLTDVRAAEMRRLGGIALLAGAFLAAASPATAVYLDIGHDFSFRARLYTEGWVAAESSQPQTHPAVSPFQLVSHRTFFNPELDGKLTKWQSWLDDVSFRFALWGFYDGVYDYGAAQFDRSRNSIQGRLSFGHTLTAPATRTDSLIDLRKQYTYQPDPVLGSYGDPGDVSTLPFRINEAYFNFAKGPVFLRLGRQSISWGESDTIGLLDANNPFDLTRAIPGVFEDIDEARIPLWTARATFNLFSSWGPFSSAYLDTYLVPGSIDTTVSPVPIPLASPYSPPQPDPQSLLAGLIPPDVRGPIVDAAFGGILIGLYDHLPSRSMSNSRFGVRLGGLVADYTTSVWYYRTFANQPVPRFLPLDISRAPIVRPGATGPTNLVTELHHGLVDVFGAGTSFFSEKLDGIVRGEVEYFLDEPAFIPNENIPFERLLRTPAVRKLLATLGQHVPPGLAEGTIPHADLLRFELGYDRFFFFRPLNPYNSFTWVTAYVGQWNLSETFGNKDYRFGGQQKLDPNSPTGVRAGANTAGLSIATISKLHTVPTDFVDLYPYESFVQTHLQTDYLHGRLTPSVTLIVGLDGVYGVPMGLTFRYSDSLIFDLKYVLLGGNFNFPFGFFRDRSELAARMTMLLN